MAKQVVWSGPNMVSVISDDRQHVFVQVLQDTELEVAPHGRGPWVVWFVTNSGGASRAGTSTWGPDPDELRAYMRESAERDAAWPED